MPWSRITSAYAELMPQEDVTYDHDFAITHDDSNVLPREHFHAQHDGMDTMDDVLCFRTLHSNPSSMHTLPDAPRIQDSKAFVTVLEHTVAPFGKAASLFSCRVLLADTETDIDSRAIIISPNTFTYDELRTMQRATPDRAAIYDFDSLEHEAMLHPDVGSLVVQRLMLTVGGQNPYIIDVTTDRRHEQLNVVKQMECLRLADVRHVKGEEYHCCITALGWKTARTSFKLVGHELMHTPLPGQVRSPR